VGDRVELLDAMPGMPAGSRGTVRAVSPSTLPCSSCAGWGCDDCRGSGYDAIDASVYTIEIDDPRWVAARTQGGLLRRMIRPLSLVDRIGELSG